MTRNRPAAATQPKFPALRKKCKYCRCEFTTPATANGQKMDFCKPAHRWAFAREGKKPIDFILKKQDKRMREIAREEVAAALDRFATITMLQVLPKLLDRFQPIPNTFGPPCPVAPQTTAEAFAQANRIGRAPDSFAPNGAIIERD